MIDRRKLFSFGLASAGLCTTPRWLARWFEPQDPEAVKDPEQDPGQDPRSRQLRAALRTAQRQGKPVLLFVVPDAQQGAQVWNRGKWFGAFLNHGGDLALLEVALCVPACATLAELREIAGAGPIAGDPAIVLLDVGADGDAAKVTPVPCELGDYGGQVRADETWDDMVARQRRHIEAKLRELTEELMAAMHRHGHNLAAAAKAVDARLTDTARGALDDWFAGGTAPADATLVLAAAEPGWSRIGIATRCSGPSSARSSAGS